MVFANSTKYFIAAFEVGAFWKAPIAVLLACIAWVLPAETQQSAGIGCIALMVLDYITGVIASARTGKAITSKRMRESVLKPLTYVVLVLAVAVISNLLEVGKKLEGAGVSATLAFIAATECKSLFENLIKAGVKLPPKLRAIFIGSEEIEQE